MQSTANSLSKLYMGWPCFKGVADTDCGSYCRVLFTKASSEGAEGIEAERYVHWEKKCYKDSSGHVLGTVVECLVLGFILPLTLVIIWISLINTKQQMQSWLCLITNGIS